MLKLVFFAPVAAVEKVKQALFAKGAGRDDKYKNSCWQVSGQLEYIPLPASDPDVGEQGEQVQTEEYRVEMLCQEQFIKSVIEELHRVHPYEKPAYEIYPLIQKL